MNAGAREARYRQRPTEKKLWVTDINAGGNLGWTYKSREEIRASRWTALKVLVIARPGFEPGSPAPKASMLGRYTTGLLGAGIGCPGCVKNVARRPRSRRPS